MAKAAYEIVPESEILAVSVNDPTRGTTNSLYPPGNYPIIKGSVPSITAIPSSGYYLDHWLLDGVNVGSSNPYSVTMNANHTLEAMFGSLTQWFGNPGFETGDYTDWLETYQIIESSFVHSGKYASFNQAGGASGSLGQNWPSGARPQVNQIVQFGLYFSTNGINDITGAYTTGTASQIVVEFYNDGSIIHTVYYGLPAVTAVGTWVYVDLTPTLVGQQGLTIGAFGYQPWSDSAFAGSNNDYLDDFILLTQSFP
jgi:hypothetical protein